LISKNSAFFQEGGVLNFGNDQKLNKIAKNPGAE
jgi:hypothetical protein